MNIHLSPKNFPQDLGELVARGSMRLPPLTRPQDTAFLREMTLLAMEAFWANYLESLPEEAQRSYTEALQAGNADVLLDWMRAHADWNDPDLERIGQEVLLELERRLPEAMEREYGALQDSLQP